MPATKTGRFSPLAFWWISSPAYWWFGPLRFTVFWGAFFMPGHRGGHANSSALVRRPVYLLTPRSSELRAR